MKLLVAFALFLAPALSYAGDLQVVIYNARSNRGSVLISIFDTAEAFPDEPEAAVVKLKLTTKEAGNYLIPDLPPGEYAIAILHDENGNGKMDKKALGLPKEGFAFSNNAMGTFGPPSFKKAKFEVGSGLTTQQIKMKYF